MSASTVNSACPPGAKARTVSKGGASPARWITSAKMTASNNSSTQNPSPAVTSRLISAMVTPAYLHPTLIPIKNCAAQMASDGGRCCRTPVRDKSAASKSGPRIEAPNMPARFASCQPTSPQKIIHPSCESAMLAAGAPGGLVRSAFQIQVSRKGRVTTMTKTRVA